jgi:hypothetical protein
MSDHKNDNMLNEPEMVRDVLRLVKNASLAKYSQYHAANRNKQFSVIIGLPTLVISLFLGSVLFYALGKEIPTWGKWIGGFLGFLAATLSLFQTFFNFSHNFESHRKLGNSYLEIERKAIQVIRQFDDGLVDIALLNDKAVYLLDEYMKINRKAEKYPANQNDFNFARNKIDNWHGVGNHSFSKRD